MFLTRTSIESTPLQDYAVDPEARNDLGLFFLLSIEVATKKCVIGTQIQVLGN